jgi:hypothetical protein
VGEKDHKSMSMKEEISAFEADCGNLKCLFARLCPSEYLKLLQTENKDFPVSESSTK